MSPKTAVHVKSGSLRSAENPTRRNPLAVRLAMITLKVAGMTLFRSQGTAGKNVYDIDIAISQVTKCTSKELLKSRQIYSLWECGNI